MRISILAFGVAAVLAIPWSLAAEPADDAFTAGIASQDKGDLPEALANYTKAVELRTNFVKAYDARGVVRQNLGDLTGAAADFNKALQLDTNNAEAFFGRGRLNQITGHLEDALADFSKSLELNPVYAAYFGRGRIEELQGKLDAAIADYSKTMELAPQFASAYYFRGCARYNTHLFDKALEDFQKVCALNSPSDYAHFRVWLTQARLGQRDEATKELSTYLNLRPGGLATGWVAKIGAYLTGQLPEADFLKAAEDGDNKAGSTLQREAFFFVGSLRLIAKDQDGAKTYFAKCVATGAPEDPSYQSAAAELKFLEPAK